MHEFARANAYPYRFLWVYLVLDIIEHDCPTQNAVTKAINELPSKLEEIYVQCLNRVYRAKMIRNPMLLMYVCAAPEPLHHVALSQLLALKLSNGEYDNGDTESRTSLLRSGVGLVSLDASSKMIVPVHGSVRTFIFSEKAITNLTLPSQNPHSDVSNFRWIRMTWPDHSCESAVRLLLGYACLIHLQKGTHRALVSAAAEYQTGVPSTAMRMPPLARKLWDAYFPRASSAPLVDLRLPPTRPRDYAFDTSFLKYATTNWMSCNRELRSRGEWSLYTNWLPASSATAQQQDHRDLFRYTAMERNDSWKLHPWHGTGGTTQHLAGMFAASVSSNHLPLLLVALERRSRLPMGFFDGLLPDHGELPALHVACKAGYIELIPSLIQVCDVEKRCRSSRTALHYAAESGHKACVEMLLQKSHIENRRLYVNYKDNMSQTAIQLSAKHGHWDIVNCLLEMYEAYVCMEQIVDMFKDRFQFTADQRVRGPTLGEKERNILQERDSRGRTAITLAAIAGHVALVADLSFSINLHEPDNDGLTAFWHACHRGQAPVVEFLLQRRYVDWIQEISVTDKWGHTALSAAAREGHNEVVELLVNSRFRSQSLHSDVRGWLPIEHAVFGLYTGSSESAAKGIVKAIATTYNIEPGDTKNFFTFLNTVADAGQLDAVQHLLQQWEQLVAEDRTAMHPAHALTYESVAYIVARKIPLQGFHDTDKAGVRFPVAIRLASARGHEDVLSLLVRNNRSSRALDAALERARADKSTWFLRRQWETDSWEYKMCPGPLQDWHHFACC